MRKLYKPWHSSSREAYKKRHDYYPGITATGNLHRPWHISGRETATPGVTAAGRQFNPGITAAGKLYIPWHSSGRDTYKWYMNWHITPYRKPGVQSSRGIQPHMQQAS